MQSNYHRPMKKRTPLNLRDLRVQELANKYNLQPKAVAYIRAAIIGEFARYNKESLIEHIQLENEKRYKAIEEHKVSELLSPQEKEKVIEYTMLNITFREGIVEILNRLQDDELKDILQ